jgi:hypothetical protein
VTDQNATSEKRPSKANAKTAMVLVSIAAVFFFGVIVKRWMFP